MKQITPMARLKDNFTKFNIITDELFKIVELQKTEPKYNPTTYEYSKGIKNDFLRIYVSKENQKHSFGFSIDNIKNELDKVLLSVSLKKGDDLQSVVVNYETFKNKFKELIKTLSVLKDVNSLNEKSIFISIDKIFNVFNKQKDEVISETIVKKAHDEIVKLQKVGTSLKRKKTTVSNNLDLDLAVINSEVKKLKSELKFSDLEDEYKKIKTQYDIARKKINSKIDEIEKNKNFSVKKNQLRRIENEIRLNDNKLITTLENYIKPYHKNIRDLVKKAFKIK